MFMFMSQRKMREKARKQHPWLSTSSQAQKIREQSPKYENITDSLTHMAYLDNVWTMCMSQRKKRDRMKRYNTWLLNDVLSPCSSKITFTGTDQSSLPPHCLINQFHFHSPFLSFRLNLIIHGLKITDGQFSRKSADKWLPPSSPPEEQEFSVFEPWWEIATKQTEVFVFR